MAKWNAKSDQGFYIYFDWHLGRYTIFIAQKYKTFDKFDEVNFKIHRKSHSW